LIGSFDLTIRDVDGQTPLHLAVQNDKKGVVQLLINASSKSSRRIEFERILRLLEDTKYEQVDMIFMLLESDSDISSTGHFGLTPLVLALAYSDNVEAIDRLIFQSHNTSLERMNQQTPLCLLARKELLGVLRVLRPLRRVSHVILPYFEDQDDRSALITVIRLLRHFSGLKGRAVSIRKPGGGGLSPFLELFPWPIDIDHTVSESPYIYAIEPTRHEIKSKVLRIIASSTSPAGPRGGLTCKQPISLQLSAEVHEILQEVTLVNRLA